MNRIRVRPKKRTPTHSRGSNRKLQQLERRRRREERLLRYLNKFPAVLICIITAAGTKPLPTPIMRGRHPPPRARPRLRPLLRADAPRPNTYTCLPAPNTDYGVKSTALSLTIVTNDRTRASTHIYEKFQVMNNV
ncbi:unnamed protein product [Arctia plantaginis]|uniref:Uncharacterized protein n=1 Tax=Arctia plantaginis TaxID=874455 RepID=A0A8S1BLH8_ARCPL|nr:unnamed protein product [Arctia plantaginis]CAB3259982.1 unnamed protein product [Arctia plantaginis]